MACLARLRRRRRRAALPALLKAPDHTARQPHTLLAHAVIHGGTAQADGKGLTAGEAGDAEQTRRTLVVIEQAW